MALRGAQHTQTGPTQTMPAAGVHLWKRLKSAILGKKRGPFFKKKALGALFSAPVALYFCRGVKLKILQKGGGHEKIEGVVWGAVRSAPPAPQAPGVQGQRPDAEKNETIAPPEIPKGTFLSFLGFSWHFSLLPFYCFPVSWTSDR